MELQTKTRNRFGVLVAIGFMVAFTGVGLVGCGESRSSSGDSQSTSSRSENLSPQQLYEQYVKHKEGECVKVDYKKARRFLEKAAKGGDPIALMELVRCYEKGNELLGIEKDKDKAKQLLEKVSKDILEAAKKGNTRAMLVIVDCYANGRGVDEDTEEANKWLKKWEEKLKQAENPDVHELAVLAEFYRAGMGKIEANQEEADNYDKKVFKLHKQKAEKGDAKAMHALANCYKDGSGVDKDREQAEKWFKKSAEKGHVPAMLRLAVMLLEDKDKEAAVGWVRKAAEAGCVEAQLVYGKILCEGLHGVTKDVKKGKEWLRKAKDAGYSPAKEALNELDSVSDDD